MSLRKKEYIDRLVDKKIEEYLKALKNKKADG